MAPRQTLRPVQRPRLYEQVAQQISEWIEANGLGSGDRLPPERELAARLGVSRATVSQALVALEVVGVVVVRHGDGAILSDAGGTSRVVEAIRDHARRLPEVIDARDALETKLAALAAERRTEEDLHRIEEALRVMEADIKAGGRGDVGDELFHGAVTAAAHSELLARMMSEIGELIAETRIESLGQPGRPRDSLAAHRRVAAAIRAGDATAAARAMHDHIEQVSDVAILHERS
ncbi:FadR/GntR family transcriptional regulator [uncultured Aeromicrobium sp.]|uniref:FadR/GntR family transcriptional regulator n=1 Tax=uncultured Aeromicrobium sp. TaxID=337820 RepID=UPI0025E3F6E5|nr:FCD domain-containing protein [uncultured Aeromicrobium sp.]